LLQSRLSYLRKTLTQKQQEKQKPRQLAGQQSYLNVTYLTAKPSLRQVRIGTTSLIGNPPKTIATLAPRLKPFFSPSTTFHASSHRRNSSNELWNVNTLELPSTITAANEPSSSTATTLSNKIEVLTRVTKTAELDGFTLDHKDLGTRSKETKARLENDEATLQQLATEKQTLLADTLREKAT
jgi:hypothetical protein